MRSALGRSGHITAAVTFYTLVFLSVGLLVALSGFVSYFAPLYDACASAWDNLLSWVSSLGVFLPLAVALSVVGAAGLTLARQWLTTRRLLASLAPHRVPAPARLARIAREVGLDDRIDCVGGALAIPFCYGFLRPRVCVPTSLMGILDDSELRAVLRHEGYHARSRDPLKIWLSRALARGLYFLPLAGDLRDSYLSAKEVAADETMTTSMDELPLASALLKLLSTDRQPLGWPVEVGSGLFSGKSLAGLISVSREPATPAEERIRRLVDGRPVHLRLPSVASVLVSAVIVIAIFAVSYASLSAAPTMPASQECAAESLHLGRETISAQPVEVNQAGVPAAKSSSMRDLNGASVEFGLTYVGANEVQPSCNLLTPICARSRQPVTGSQITNHGFTDH
ncbi:MAG: M56 family metallopeptidase [Anaerolineae bacterium]